MRDLCTGVLLYCLNRPLPDLRPALCGLQGGGGGGGGTGFSHFTLSRHTSLSADVHSLRLKLPAGLSLYRGSGFLSLDLGYFSKRGLLNDRGFFARVLSLDRRVFSRMLFTCPGSFEQDAFHLTGEFITRGGLSLDRRVFSKRVFTCLGSF